MIRILHTGDLHLDSAFRGLSPEKARLRREEQREILESISALVQEESIPLVLLAGDLFDGDNIYYETALMLSEVLGRIPARIFISPGNHDPYGDRSPYTQVRWPENVHIFRTASMERVVLPELGCVVYGCAFRSRYRESSPLEGFVPGEDEGLVRLMVLHGDISGWGRYGPVTPEQLENTGMDYIALGHIHATGGIQRRGNTCYAYCGCPEGRGFDETGEKGLYVGEVSGENVRMEFRSVSCRSYCISEVSVTGKEPAQALLEAAQREDPRNVLRFVLTGTRRQERLDTEALEELLEGRFFHAQVRDRTRPEADPWARLEEDTLVGMYLRRMKELLEQAQEEQRPVLERALEYGMAALEGREGPK